MPICDCKRAGVPHFALVLIVLTPGVLVLDTACIGCILKTTVLQIIQQRHQKNVPVWNDSFRLTTATILKLTIYSNLPLPPLDSRCQTVQISHDEFLRATITLQLDCSIPASRAQFTSPAKRGKNLQCCNFLNAKLYLHPPKTNDTTEHGTSEALGDAGEATFG